MWELCSKSSKRNGNKLRTTQTTHVGKVRLELQPSASWASEENLAFFALGCEEEQIARCLRDGKGGTSCCTIFDEVVSRQLEGRISNKTTNSANWILFSILCSGAMPHLPKPVKVLWRMPQFMQTWNDTDIEQHRCCKTLTFGKVTYLSCKCCNTNTIKYVQRRNECNN